MIFEREQQVKRRERLPDNVIPPITATLMKHVSENTFPVWLLRSDGAYRTNRYHRLKSSRMQVELESVIPEGSILKGSCPLAKYAFIIYVYDVLNFRYPEIKYIRVVP